MLTVVGLLGNWRNNDWNSNNNFRYIFNLTLGGINEILYNVYSYNLIILFVSIFVIYFVIGIYAIKVKVFNQSRLFYNVRVTIDSKKYYLKSYLDTGNFLTYDFIPVILIKNRSLLIKPYKLININGAINESKMMLYKADKIEIMVNKNYIEKDAYLGYANLDVDAIIGLKVLGGWND